MKNKNIITLLLVLIVSFSLLKDTFSYNTNSSDKTKKKGAYFTSKYENLFVSLLGKKETAVKEKVDKAFNHLFYGNDSTERVYYPAGMDMAYIKDVLHNDVRTEGMSYGMMIAVQLDKKKEFDCLWKWAKTFMQHKSGQRAHYFAWQLKTSGEIIDSNSASDGEEWYVTALFFASARWGNGEGIYNYKNEAQLILDAMIGKTESSDRTDIVTNIFNKKEKQIVFVPIGNADDFTDPSYHLPHFYEYWSIAADKDNQFWKDAAITSRKFLKKTVNPKTGLAPDYANFDGTPNNFFNGGTNNFQYDACRVAANIAMDYVWFAKDKWEVKQSNRLLNFFYSQGMGKYGNLYTLDGKCIGKDHTTSLVSMNAVAALAANNKIRKEFIEEFWNTPIPSGLYRYYDGMLYMLGLLEVSGNFRIYENINK